MSLSGSNIPARSDLKIVVRSGQIILVRSVRIFKITTETTSDNVLPFLKHIRETVATDATVDTEATDATVDTDSVDWKTNWMNDIIHNTLNSIHRIRWSKIRMLANLNKDCTTKQLITSLRNFYPILNEYYSFVYNDDDDFEVMVTITSITETNVLASKTSMLILKTTLVAIHLSSKTSTIVTSNSRSRPPLSAFQ